MSKSKFFQCCIGGKKKSSNQEAKKNLVPGNQSPAQDANQEVARIAKALRKHGMGALGGPKRKEDCIIASSPKGIAP